MTDYIVNKRKFKLSLDEKLDAGTCLHYSDEDGHIYIPLDFPELIALRSAVDQAIKTFACEEPYNESW